jgi:hypothetical protein
MKTLAAHGLAGGIVGNNVVKPDNFHDSDPYTHIVVSDHASTH